MLGQYCNFSSGNSDNAEDTNAYLESLIRKQKIPRTSQGKDSARQHIQQSPSVVQKHQGSPANAQKVNTVIKNNPSAQQFSVENKSVQMKPQLVSQSLSDYINSQLQSKKDVHNLENVQKMQNLLATAFVSFVVRQEATCSIGQVSSPIEYICLIMSKSEKHMDTLVKYHVQSGSIQEVALSTLAKVSSSKLIEVRKDFAVHVDYQKTVRVRIDSSASGSGKVEERIDVHYLKWPSVFIHGGFTVNQRTKKAVYQNDLYHIDSETGLVRKFFLMDGPKARGLHAITKSQTEEVLYVYGGVGLKDTFEDLWRIDLDNVTWKDQKQSDLVGAVAEKISFKLNENCPGKLFSHQMFSFGEVICAVTDQNCYFYDIYSNQWEKLCLNFQYTNDSKLFQIGKNQFAVLNKQRQSLALLQLNQTIELIDEVQLGNTKVLVVWQTPILFESLTELHIYPIGDNNKNAEYDLNQQNQNGVQEYKELEEHEQNQSENANLEEQEARDNAMKFGEISNKIQTQMPQEIQVLEASEEGLDNQSKQKKEIRAKMDESITDQFNTLAQMNEHKTNEASILKAALNTGNKLAVKLDEQTVQIFEQLQNSNTNFEQIQNEDELLKALIEKIVEEKLQYEQVLQLFLQTLNTFQSEAGQNISKELKAEGELQTSDMFDREGPHQNSVVDLKTFNANRNEQVCATTREMDPSARNVTEEDNSSKVYQKSFPTPKHATPLGYHTRKKQSRIKTGTKLQKKQEEPIGQKNRFSKKLIIQKQNSSKAQAIMQRLVLNTGDDNGSPFKFVKKTVASGKQNDEEKDYRFDTIVKTDNIANETPTYAVLAKRKNNESSQTSNSQSQNIFKQVPPLNLEQQQSDLSNSMSDALENIQDTRQRIQQIQNTGVKQSGYHVLNSHSQKTRQAPLHLAPHQHFHPQHLSTNGGIAGASLSQGHKSEQVTLPAQYPKFANSFAQIDPMQQQLLSPKSQQVFETYGQQQFGNNFFQPHYQQVFASKKNSIQAQQHGSFISSGQSRIGTEETSNQIDQFNFNADQMNQHDQMQNLFKLNQNLSIQVYQLKLKLLQDEESHQKTKTKLEKALFENQQLNQDLVQTQQKKADLEIKVMALERQLQYTKNKKQAKSTVSQSVNLSSGIPPSQIVRSNSQHRQLLEEMASFQGENNPLQFGYDPKTISQMDFQNNLTLQAAHSQNIIQNQPSSLINQRKYQNQLSNPSESGKIYHPQQTQNSVNDWNFGARTPDLLIGHHASRSQTNLNAQVNSYQQSDITNNRQQKNFPQHMSTQDHYSNNTQTNHQYTSSSHHSMVRDATPQLRQQDMRRTRIPETVGSLSVKSRTQQPSPITQMPRHQHMTQNTPTPVITPPTVHQQIYGGNLQSRQLQNDQSQYVAPQSLTLGARVMRGVPQLNNSRQQKMQVQFQDNWHHLKRHSLVSYVENDDGQIVQNRFQEVQQEFYPRQENQIDNQNQLNFYPNEQEVNQISGGYQQNVKLVFHQGKDAAHNVKNIDNQRSNMNTNGAKSLQQNLANNLKQSQSLYSKPTNMMPAGNNTSSTQGNETKCDLNSQQLQLQQAYRKLARTQQNSIAKANKNKSQQTQHSVQMTNTPLHSNPDSQVQGYIKSNIPTNDMQYSTLVDTKLAPTSNQRVKGHYQSQSMSLQIQRQQVRDGSQKPYQSQQRRQPIMPVPDTPDDKDVENLDDIEDDFLHDLEEHPEEDLIVNNNQFEQIVVPLQSKGTTINYSQSSRRELANEGDIDEDEDESSYSVKPQIALLGRGRP